MAKRKAKKPAKPYRDFPLFAHNNGQWAKKIKGKLYYFGPWNDSEGSRQRYLSQADDLRSGRTPRPQPESITVFYACDQFLAAKDQIMQTGGIVRRTWLTYQETSQMLVDHFGKSKTVASLTPVDFEGLRANLAERFGVTRLGNEIQRVRSVFKYAYDAGLIDSPVRFGPLFRKPSQRQVRIARNQKPPRSLSAEEIRQLILAAAPNLAAMILLGINCGFGNSDLGNMPLTAIDFDLGWVNYPRPKTGVERRCPLWGETIEYLRAALEVRPKPKPAADHLFFVTNRGNSFAKDGYENPISSAFRHLLKQQDLYRPGANFYALRHTFETVAGGSKDQVAVNYLMGHVDNSMSAVYRESIDDDRLIAVAQHVRTWLEK